MSPAILHKQEGRIHFAGIPANCRKRDSKGEACYRILRYPTNGAGWFKGGSADTNCADRKRRSRTCKNKGDVSRQTTSNNRDTSNDETSHQRRLRKPNHKP